jgi:hypothetical protein
MDSAGSSFEQRFAFTANTTPDLDGALFLKSV